MSGEKGNSKADTLVKVVLVFFISLLSFSVGTFVGKQVSDSDHRRMALEGEYKGDRSVASTDKEEGSEPSDAKISEKEVESLTEEFVNKEKTRKPADESGAEAKPAGREIAAAGHEVTHEEAAPEAAGKEGYKSYPRHAGGAEAPAAKAEAPKKSEAGREAKAEANAHSKASAMKPDATHKVAEKVVEGKAPTDGAKESRKPQSTLPSVASSAVGKFSVQVAAYATEGEAKNHAAGLKEKGYNAFYLSRTENGKTWFRVLVGLFNTESSARQFRAQFMKEANTKDAFVKKIVE